ncbi:MAG TPA: ATP-grasp domain-containing protein [Polyangiaceae bacterium]|nr:ATP-grasp domain-containing protein [Polyangiaceae bacterium]
MHFLFPNDTFSPRAPDDAFRAQADALAARGHGVSLISLEELQAGRARVRGALQAGTPVAYRGWMLNEAEYGRLVEAVRELGAEPLTPLDTYLGCHHLPRWYPLLHDLTAETRVYPANADLETELRSLGWGTVFLKDYVKSLKTSVGSVVSRPEQVREVLSEMEKYRGEIEGGVCVRRFEAFREGSEVRYFVLNGKAHAAAGAAPAIVEECTRRISSPFFSVDIAIREDGVERVVEIGDGQVSDLVGWSLDAFSDLWPPEPA